MCKIGINLDTTTPTGTLIESAIGRYRVVGGGEGDWVNFNIILSSPETPNISIIGSYELQVNVTNNVDGTSDWSDSVTFTIASDCGGGTDTGGGDDGGPDPEICYTYTLIPNEQKQIWGVDSIWVNYTECETGLDKTISISPGQGSIAFCASRVWSTVLNADHNRDGGVPVQLVPGTVNSVNMGSLGGNSFDDGQLQNNGGQDICTS
jgi:hypothetical protein